MLNLVKYLLPFAYLCRLSEQARDAFSLVAQTNPNLYSYRLIAPQLPHSKPQTILGIVE